MHNIYLYYMIPGTGTAGFGGNTRAQLRCGSANLVKHPVQVAGINTARWVFDGCIEISRF
jgi:hypothetical protein